MKSSNQPYIIGAASVLTGVTMLYIPAELWLYFMLLVAGGGAGSVGVYHASSLVRQGVHTLGDHANRLLNPPPRAATPRALPAPNAEALLEAFLAEAPPEPFVPPRRATTAVPVQRQAAPQRVLTPPPPAEPDPDPEPVAVWATWHPELRSRWADMSAAAQIEQRQPLGQSLREVVAELAVALDAVQVRVAAPEAWGDDDRPALALYLTHGPLTAAQQGVLRRWGGWWQPYTAGRLHGALVALAGPPVELADTPRDDNMVYEPASDMVVAPPPAVAAPPPPSPVLSARPAPARPAPRQLNPPQPRLITDSAIPIIEVAVGAADGEWYYVPLKHGLLANGTGGGKTNLLDFISGQVQALGDQVDLWYATAKPYVMITPEDRLDRRPLIQHLDPEQVALDHEGILSWIWRARERMQLNYRRMQQQPGWFPKPMVVIFDEAKAYFELVGAQKAQAGEQQVPIADLVSSCMKQLVILGREAGGCLIFTSQDGYCGSLKLTKGEMGNLGFRMIHPQLDPNSLKNVLPEGTPPMLNPGKWQWWCASGGKLRLVSIPRVNADMFRAWGLIADAPPVEPEPARDLGRSLESAPQVAPIPDADLLRWVIAQSRRGVPVTVEAAAAQFGVLPDVMRAALERNGLLDGDDEGDND